MPTGIENFRNKYPGSYDDMSDDQLGDALYKKHYSDMPRAQFDEKMGLERYDPHREESGLGAVTGSIGRAAKALPGSAAHAGEQLWNLVTNYDKVYANVKELGFSGVAKAIGSDLAEHYGSLDKAKKTFETDPFRFLMDISAVTTGGGGLLAKLPGVAGRIGEGVAAAGRAVDPLAMAGRVTAATVREPAAGLLGRTTGTGAQTMRQAEEAGYQGTRMPTAARPLLPQGLRRHGALSGGVLDYLTGGHVSHLAAQHPILSAAGAAVASPRLAGSAMYGLGAAQRYGERLAPAARGAALALPGRKEIRDKAQAALRDPEFKKGKDQEQLKPVRKVARDPNADSRTMQAAQRALGGYRPLQLTVRPEQGGYGGTEGGQSNDATSGVVSRQEGGPVAPGRAYSVGDAPGATPDTPKPETFIPDRGPSPAQAAGGAATEAVGWVSDAWASILKGEKPPPLPGLPEAGKVPSTADPRPTQALGEETSFLSQFAGPPGAAAAKGLGAAALGTGALRHGLSAVKLAKPVEEMLARRVGTPTASKLITPAELQGGYIFPAIGDRSMAGQQLTGVGGQRLSSPVELQGGPRYMPEHAGQGSVWASGPSVITRLENRAQQLAQGGKPVYMPYSAMGERSVDYSHHMSDTLSEMMKTAKVTKKSAAEFDKAMREPTADYKEPIKDWPGVQTKGLRKYLMEAGGNVRNKFAQTMDSRKFQDAGFPSVGEARFAVTDPRLLHEPTGAAGIEIAETMPGAPRPPPEHRTYETGMPGIYRGSLGASVPREIMFQDPMRKISQMENPNRAFSMQLPAQETHQQWVDSVSEWLRKYRGIPLSVTAGMSVPELKRLLNETPSDR